QAWQLRNRPDVTRSALEYLGPVRRLIRTALEETQMAMTMAPASATICEGMGETVKRYSTWYLLEGVLLVVAGVVALIWPYVASVALIFLLGWILIVTGVQNGIVLHE